MPPRYSPPPPRGHRNSYHLNPEAYYSGQGRSNSRGRDGPTEVHIHNDMYQEGPYQDARDQPMPSPPVGYPRGRSPYRGYPEEPAYGYPVPLMPYRSHSRSRSRGDSDYWRKKAIEDYKRDEEEREREKERAVEDHAREQSKERKKEKEAQLEAVRKYEQDKKDEEEKQKKAWEEYEAKKREKERLEKEKKAKEDEEYRERLRKHLATLGYAQNQIDVIVANETKKTEGESNSLVRTPSAQTQLALGQKPLVYPKIRRQYIAVETLKFYDLKWKYDESDSDFIVILHEMSDRETDVLFAHTARLREKGKGTFLQLEDSKKKKPEYVMIRRRSKSRGKSPSGREKLAEAVLKGST